MKLFHLTTKELGVEVVLKPFVCENSAQSEIKEARVCASPSIEGCIYGLHTIEWFKESKNDGTLCLFVYEIVDTSTFSPYENVYDFNETNEHISFQSAKAKLVGIIHIPKHNYMKYLGDTTKVNSVGCVYEWISEDCYNEYYA